MTEEWRPVLGWEGLYEVSNQGRVRSVNRVAKSRPGVTRAIKGKVLRPRNPRGMRRCRACKNQLRRNASQAA